MDEIERLKNDILINTFRVGCIYHQGVKQNFDEAFKYFKMAADAGNIQAKKYIEKEKKLLMYLFH